MSPTERPPITSLGKSSSKPELYGADILFRAGGGWSGIQRKELSDFVASVQDGRLAKEVAQMYQLTYKLLVVEGVPRWSLDGNLILRGQTTRWTVRSHYSYLWSVMARGVMVVSTVDAQGTVDCARWFEEWSRKENRGEHRALDTRPGPVVAYGKPGSRDWERHVVCGFPGVGPERADAMLDHCGRLPLKWDVGAEEMLEVPGWGKGTVEKVRKMLGQE